MKHVHEGMEVNSYDMRIGVVEGVAQGGNSDRPALIIRRDGGLLQAAPANSYDVSDGAVRIEESLLQDVIDAASAGTRTVESSEITRSLDAATVASGSTQRTQSEANDELRIPIMEEQVVVERREVERGGVRVHKRVHEREEVVEQPTYHDEVSVERVAIGKYVDFVPQPREEGDTLIIPLLEEVLVVEKRLMVKEELRITRRRTEETQQTRITLRQEEAIVERIDENEAGA